MYQVSEAYKNAIRQETQIYRMRGRIGNVNFTDENILAGTFTITNQCSGESTLDIGQVYIGELSATFRGLNINRYDWIDSKVTPYFGLKIPNDLYDQYEEVPLGVYTISEVTHGAEGVQVRAYDNMSKFDASYQDDAKARSAYEWADRACDACRVTLGMTKREMEALPNGNITLKVYAASSTDIKTWRDLLAWLAQTLCANATMDRQGRLVFRTWQTEPVDSIDNFHRFKGASFSGYVTKYTGMSCVDMSTQMTRYYKLPGLDDGLTYNLGSNPFLQYGSEQSVTAHRRAVLNGLRNIRYVPFKTTSLQDPAYDLMDVIRFEDGIADGTKISCITKFTYGYRSGMQMTGAGEDPALASGLSKTDKNISGLLDQLNTIKNSEVNFFFYINRGAFQIADGSSVVVADINYGANPSDGIIFHGEIRMTVTTTETVTAAAYTENDAIITVTYLVDGREMSDYYSADAFQDGTRLLNLLYFFDQGEASEGNFKARISVSGGSLAIAAGDSRGYITAKTREYKEFYIEITKQPDKAAYVEGETLDYTGLVVSKIYEDGTTVNITDQCTISPAEGTVLPPIEAAYADVTVTVTYQEADKIGEMITYTETFTVTEEALNLTVESLEVYGIQTEYIPGEYISYDGASAWAYYSDGSSEDVTNLITWDPEDGTEVTADWTGETVTASYTYKDDTVTASIELTLAAITDILVTRLPDRLYYNDVTEENPAVLDFTGLQLTAYTWDGRAFDATYAAECSPAEGTEYTEGSSARFGVVPISVSTSDGGWTQFSVSVNSPDDEAEIIGGNELRQAIISTGGQNVETITRADQPGAVLSSITVSGEPRYTVHNDYNGITVTATFADGTTADVTDDCEYRPVSGTYAKRSIYTPYTVAVSYTYGGTTRTTSFTYQWPDD